MAVELVELPDTTVLIKLHGTFMVIAYVLFSSLGSAVARYFKKTWVTKEYFGGAAWFLYHRMYTFFTWLLTCCGFIIIFIDVDGWHGHAHAVVGLVTFILCFLQPIFGAARPPGQAKKIIRLLHVLSGHVVHLLAITNLFLAVRLRASKLPDSMYGWFAGAVAFQLVIHVTFNILEYLSSKKEASLDPTKDASFSRWRKVTLMVQMIGLLAFTMVIVVMIWRT